MLIHTQRVPQTDCRAGCCFIPRESHTRAGLPSRMLIHTQIVSQRAGLPRMMLFHTQRVPYKGWTAEQDADTYPESPTKGQTGKKDTVSYLESPIQGPDCRAGCWYIPRESHKGPDCQEGCCFIPRESHTRAGLPSRMLIHTQRVPHKGRTAEQDAVSYPEYHTRARLPSRMLYHTQLSEPVYIGGLPSSLPTVTRSTMQLYCVSVNNSYIYIYKMLSFKSTLKDTTFTLLFNLVNF